MDKFSEGPYQKILQKGDEALKRYQELMDSLEGNQPRTGRAESARKVDVKSSLGNSLKKLCEECGWTPYQLHKQSGLDKKLVLGHYSKGKGCSLQTRTIYEDVFSKKLGRRISIDLEP